MPEILLRSEGLSKRFGGVAAVEGLDFALEAGSTLGLIGPNGAGKTTVFNLLTGLLRPDAGRVLFREGENLSGRSPDHIASRGIARTFQNIRLFPAISALENILVAMHCKTGSGMAEVLLRPARAAAEERRAHGAAMELLRFVGLEASAYAPAEDLPYGQQRLLEIARALALEPVLLLLDEPAAGMNHAEKAHLMELIGKLQRRGLALLIIEHDMQVVMPLSDRVLVMDHGCKLAEGPPCDVQRHPDVIRAYLGE